MVFPKSPRDLLPAVLLLAVCGISVQAQQQANVPAMAFENVPYGDHPNQIIDFWQADVDGPAPLVIYIHGGGFRGGSHDRVTAEKIRHYLDAGIHHASVEYRLLKHARLPAAHEDVVRALQFIRSKAGEWNIDKERIAAYGGSAGAQLAVYLAWADDFADPGSEDPVARESSRLAAVAPRGGQSTMDLDWWVENIPGYVEAYHSRGDYFDLSEDKKAKIIEQTSIINHISPDDPPTFLSYGMQPDGKIPDDPKRARGWSIHHVNFGIAMEDKLRQAGVEVYLQYPGVKLPFENEVEFLVRQLKK